MEVVRKIFSAVALALMVACSGYVDPEKSPESENGGPDSESGPALSSGYLQQMVAMQFTSVGCVNCPTLASSIKNIQKNMPGIIIPVAFHMNYDISDPMTLSENALFYEKVDYVNDGTKGLPMFALNFRKGSAHIVSEYAKIQSEIAYQAEKYPADCGVAIETGYNPATRSVSVKARFKSDVAKSYRYHIFLLEDGIEYMQMGVESGSYVHDNVLRRIVGSDARGTRLNSGSALEAGKEYVVEKTMELSSDWKSENMKVLVAMLKEDSSADWGSYNANVCALGASVDYMYEK